MMPFEISDTPCADVDVVVVDANNLLYRMGHMAGGETCMPTIVEFVKKLLMIRSWYEAEPHVCWEGLANGADNWRFEIHPQYKGQREPSELSRKVKRAQQILKKLLCHTNIAQWDGIKGEGDDIMATVAKKLEREGKSVGIYSTDRDLLQLASEKITLIVPQRNASDMALGPREVVEVTGLLPRFVPHVKALVGDVGDNIPGVSGIGKKLATELIRHHGSVHAVIEAAKAEDLDRQECETKKAYKERLKEEWGSTESKRELVKQYEAQALMSFEVGGIRDDLEVFCVPDSPTSKIELQTILEDLGAYELFSPVRLNNITQVAI